MIELLKKIPLFENLSEYEFEEMKKICVRRVLAKLRCSGRARVV